MTRLNILLGTGIAAVIACAGVQAKANPVSIAYSLDNGSTIIDLDSGQGSAGVSGTSVGTYHISLSATGSPILVNPNFGSNTLTVDSTGPGTIMLYATETKDSAIVPSFTIGLSNNPLSDTGVTEAVYSDDSNQKYGTATLLASATLAPGDAVSMNAPFGNLSKPYSITEIYTITFGAGGGAVNATILEKANVPEPMSISLLGAGLAGLGFIRLRRKA